MYFKSTFRINPATQKTESYYRLVESYRNENNRVCHTTLLNIGFINYSIETLNTIRHLLIDRIAGAQSVFEAQDTIALHFADLYWDELIRSGKIDVSEKGQAKKERMVDIESLRHKDAREIGSEWLCYQGLEQLEVRERLSELGWDEEEVQLALTQIISRSVYPFSELKTSKWIQENSAVCEITGYPIEKVTKDKLYKSALGLYKIKDILEEHLSTKTNELFDLQDKIILYDLTNTYFEGSKHNSRLAQYGRSKEKRNDAKLVVLALVVNIEGFIKYSQVLEGNKSDSTSLPEMIDRIRLKTSEEKRAIVVLDAGIATKENLELIQAKGYDYVCVSRTKIKDYNIDATTPAVKVETKNREIIELEKIQTDAEADYILKVKSPGKTLKERGMKNRFEERFLLEIEKTKASLTKKNGIKKTEKVHQRIGRIKEKYPSVAKLYEFEVNVVKDLVTEIQIKKKTTYQINEENLGIYFIRTNIQSEDEKAVWDIYNSIREIENSFRCLKTDLDLRPIYHKNDDATMAHLHLGLLAYWLVNTIRYQLKQKGINHSWQEIVRITNTQKVITTSGKNTFDKLV